MDIFFLRKGEITNYCNSKYIIKQLIFFFLSRTQLSRLIIVILNPGHDFKSMKEIQNEINSAAVDLIPINCTNFPCPFLTDGDELGGKL